MNLIRTEVTSSKNNFWNAVRIYYEHPNSINKQVLFSENVLGLEFTLSLTQNECCRIYDRLSTSLDNLSEIQFSDDLEQIGYNIVDCKNFFGSLEDFGGTFLLIRKLIPKIGGDSLGEFYEFLFFDFSKTKLLIFTKYKKNNDDIAKTSEIKDPLTILKFIQIKLSYEANFIELSYPDGLGHKGIKWLEAIFVKKFIKLLLSDFNLKEQKNSLIFSAQVDVKQYYQLYEKMKTKYAKLFIDNWTENTDPKKFVFEDIGIASYLLMLWNGGSVSGNEMKKQRFVDLGCGNGLLVHILNSEGHSGIGLDIRRRKIWKLYPETTILKEEAIIPTADTKFQDADWLIGNHSDELTAWIPVMARRSNNCCQYFVLPCCPFQLNGQRFQRKNSGMSSYQDFIAYVKDLSELCGFETFVDKLRIPSTKRICLVGYNKIEMSEDELSLINEKILSFVRQECGSSCYIKDVDTQVPSGNFGPSLNFKLRDSVEAVKNCTKLPQGLIDAILTVIMNVLLQETNFCTVSRGDKTHRWNRGGKLGLHSLAQNINKELLKGLKEECKGLQTLLKNHHFLFEVSQGYVQFRSPESMLKISKKFSQNGDISKWKKRKCWLHCNHPNKCPLGDRDCSFSHE